VGLELSAWDWTIRVQFWRYQGVGPARASVCVFDVYEVDEIGWRTSCQLDSVCAVLLKRGLLSWYTELRADTESNSDSNPELRDTSE